MLAARTLTKKKRLVEFQQIALFYANVFRVVRGWT